MIILTREQTKQLENEYVASGIDHIKLMETAGNMIFRYVCDITKNAPGLSVAIVCGRGNNGGDGFACAKRFHENGAKVRILLADGAPVTDDAIDMYERADRAGVMIIDCADPERSAEVRRSILEAEVVIDAIYGIGFRGELPESLGTIMEYMAMTDAKKIAVDVPSGIDADTGEVAPNAVKADITITFTATKPAHQVFPAAEYCGAILTAPIGIAESSIQALPKEISAIDYQDVRLCFHDRKPNTYKGSYGGLMCVCGSYGMAGAAAFASRAAVHSGVGLVNVALPKSIYPIVASNVLDPIYTPLPENEAGTLNADSADRILELLKKCTACLIGCGLGCNADTEALAARIIRECEVPLIIDADGLNAIANNVDILKEAKAPVIITPHAGEMGRLTGTDGSQVQKKRLRVAKEFAQEYGVYVVLKGANTVIADPKGQLFINRNGNPGMAKGGSGDVLAGIIGALAAQGMSIIEACTCGVFIHGEAGDYAAERCSYHAMTPNNIIAELYNIFNKIER